MRRRWCTTAIIPGGICDRSPGSEHSTIMRRDGAGTSLGSPGLDTSIGLGVITNGGSADPVGTAARRSAATPHGGGLSGTIGTMIGVATNQTRSRGRKSRSRPPRRVAAPTLARGAATPPQGRAPDRWRDQQLSGPRPCPARVGTNMQVEAGRSSGAVRKGVRVTAVSGCMPAGPAMAGYGRRRRRRIASRLLRGSGRRCNQPPLDTDLLPLPLRIDLLFLGPPPGRSCLVQLRVGRRGA